MCGKWTLPETCDQIHEDAGREVVADKGYHSNEALVALNENERRTYISEPDRGRRKWEDKEAEKAATYSNRRRIRGDRGKRLLRKRGELLERPFAHYLEAGGMRRTHLRRHENILKRLLVHVAGFNLGILLRNLLGTGTPREYAGLTAALRRLLLSLPRALDASRRAIERSIWNLVRDVLLFRVVRTVNAATTGAGPTIFPGGKVAFSTGC